MLEVAVVDLSHAFDPLGDRLFEAGASFFTGSRYPHCSLQFLEAGLDIEAVRLAVLEYLLKAFPELLGRSSAEEQQLSFHALSEGVEFLWVC